MFEPILEDQPLSYAYDRPQFYRNAPREELYGVPQYFVPANQSLAKRGNGGPHYHYGYPYDENYGTNGNCCWWEIGRCAEANGIVLTSCASLSAIKFFNAYPGEKDGEGYIGDKIKAGDGLIYDDGGNGHIHFVEKVDSLINISESGDSKNALYKGKACIVYTLDPSKMICGNKIMLRPKSPYYEKLVGVIHTGLDDSSLSEKELKDLVKDLQSKIDKIKEIVND